MRHNHVAGEEIFVDYSGRKIPIADPKTGEIHEAEIFVAVLGASGYAYAEATWTQSLPDWIGSHVRMFEFFGGCPRLLVPDNLKSGINKPSFFDPEVNRSYGMMAAHYNVGILPARPRKARDKAKVEAGVRIAQTYLLGRLRNQTFFSLDEANNAIKPMVERMNDHVMRRVGVSRRIYLHALKNQRSALCRPLDTSTPNGLSHASRPTIISKSTTSSTRCLTHYSENRSRCASPAASSRSSTMQSASPFIGAVLSAVVR